MDKVLLTEPIFFVMHATSILIYYELGISLAQAKDLEAGTQGLLMAPIFFVICTTSILTCYELGITLAQTKDLEAGTQGLLTEPISFCDVHYKYTNLLQALQSLAQASKEIWEQVDKYLHGLLGQLLCHGLL